MELTLTQFALIVGLISGFVFGLIPLIVGFKKQNIKFGLIGFVLCIIAGSFLSLLGAIPVSIIFTWLILRKKPVETTADKTAENESQAVSEDSENQVSGD